MEGKPAHSAMGPRLLAGALCFLAVILRHLVAFGVGWLSAFLAYTIWVNSSYFFNGNQTVILNEAYFDVLVLSPLGIGVASALTVSNRARHPVFLALSTGLLVMTGIIAYMHPGLQRETEEMAAYTRTHETWHGGISAALVYLLLYEVYGLVLVAIISSITGFLRTFQRRREQGERQSLP